MVKAELGGQFPGGKELELAAANDGIGIPQTNPNLSDEAQKDAAQALADIKAGKITVAASADGLIK